MKYGNLTWVILIVSSCFAQDVIQPTEPTDVVPLSTYSQSPSLPSPASLNAESPISNLITQSTPEMSLSIETTHQPLVVTQFPLSLPGSTQSPSDQPWQPSTGGPWQSPMEWPPQSPNTGGTWSPSSGGSWPPGSGGPWQPGGSWSPGSSGLWPPGSNGPWSTGPTPWNPPDRWMLQQSNWTQPPNSVQPTMETQISNSSSNPMMGWMEWQRMYNISMPMMPFPPMSGSSNSSMPMMSFPSMPGSSNSSMPMTPFPQMQGSSNSSMPIIPFYPMTGSLNSSMPLRSISSMPASTNSSMPVTPSLPMSGFSNSSMPITPFPPMSGSSNSSMPFSPMPGSSNPSLPLMPLPTLIPSMPAENINQPMYYDRIEGESNIMRPCEINDIFCIRRYLRKHSHCKERYGSVPEPFYRTVSPAYFISANMTLSIEDALYRGLNGRITEFYVNPETDNLVLSVKFNNLSLESNNTFFRFHRQLQEPIVTRDFFNVYLFSPETTIMIPNLKNLELHKSEVFTYTDTLPGLVFGPNAFLSNAYTARVLPELMATLPANVREDGITNGPFYIGTFIQYRLCDFGLQIL